jgi:hypothetical protein
MMNFSSLVAHKAGDVCFPERQKQEVFAAASRDGFTAIRKTNALRFPTLVAVLSWRGSAEPASGVPLLPSRRLLN